MQTRSGPPPSDHPSNTRSVLVPSGSPYTITNNGTTNMVVLVSGGTVTTISQSCDQSNFDLVGLLGGSFLLYPGWQLRIVYILAPNIITLS